MVDVKRLLAALSSAGKGRAADARASLGSPQPGIHRPNPGLQGELQRCAKSLTNNEAQLLLAATVPLGWRNDPAQLALYNRLADISRDQLRPGRIVKLLQLAADAGISGDAPLRRLRQILVKQSITTMEPQHASRALAALQRLALPPGTLAVPTEVALLRKATLSDDAAVLTGALLFCLSKGGGRKPNPQATRLGNRLAKAVCEGSGGAGGRPIPAKTLASAAWCCSKLLQRAVLPGLLDRAQAAVGAASVRPDDASILLLAVARLRGERPSLVAGLASLLAAHAVRGDGIKPRSLPLAMWALATLEHPLHPDYCAMAGAVQKMGNAVDATGAAQVVWSLLRVSVPVVYPLSLLAQRLARDAAELKGPELAMLLTSASLSGQPVALQPQLRALCTAVASRFSEPAPCAAIESSELGSVASALVSLRIALPGAFLSLGAAAATSADIPPGSCSSLLWAAGSLRMHAMPDAVLHRLASVVHQAKAPGLHPTLMVLWAHARLRMEAGAPFAGLQGAAASSIASFDGRDLALFVKSSAEMCALTQHDADASLRRAGELQSACGGGGGHAPELEPRHVAACVSGFATARLLKGMAEPVRLLCIASALSPASPWPSAPAVDVTVSLVQHRECTAQILDAFAPAFHIDDLPPMRVASLLYACHTAAHLPQALSTPLSRRAHVFLRSDEFSPSESAAVTSALAFFSLNA